MYRPKVIHFELVADGNQTTVITNLAVIKGCDLTNEQAIGLEILTHLRADDTGRIKKIVFQG